MDIKPLRYFVEVVRHASFTRAAEVLHVAQPAVSMAIRKLEAELELTLFHRNDRKVVVTDEGQRLLEHASRILQMMDDAQLEMQELRGLTRGEVRVGIPGMLGSYYFPPILMAFRHQHPNLRLSVVEAGTGRLQEMLQEGLLDLAIFVADAVPDELDASVFLRQQMMVILPLDHALAQQPNISYEAFFKEELVLFQQGYFHRKAVDQIAKRGNCTPNIGFETNLLPLIKSIVKQGFGISTLLAMVLRDDPDLVAIPFKEPVWLDLSIAWRRQGYLSRANRAFVDFVLAHSAVDQGREQG
jgi:DNA-binding transcriptional LysR family regulator